MWVRNLLGLCFLYQFQADQAVAQYERLIAWPFADASTHANAARAYQHGEALRGGKERELRAAHSAAER